LVTDRRAVPAQTRKKLEHIVGNYLS